MNKKLTSILAIILTLALCTAIFTACSQQQTPAAGNISNELSNLGGTISLKVNPEISISYDKNGSVTSIKAENKDAESIITDYKNFEGKECKTVVTELIGLIGDAGYFVEEIDGSTKKITIEIESGSSLPSKDFLNELASNVKEYVNSKDWSSPVTIKNNADFDISDYGTTDYNDSDYCVSDYNDSDYGISEKESDYNDSDYGVSDYNDSDYGTSEKESDYNDSDYGVSDYDDSDYGTSEKESDYNDSDYGVSDYNDSDDGTNEKESDYKDSDYGASDYDDSHYN